MMTGAAPRAARAILSEQAYPPSTRFFVAYDRNSRTSLMRDLASRIADDDKLISIANPARADFYLAMANPQTVDRASDIKEGAIVIQRADGSDLSIVKGDNKNDTIEKVLQRLDEWVRWFNIKELRNPYTKLNASVMMNELRGGSIARSVSFEQSGVMKLKDGIEIELTVKNNSRNTPIYVSALYLDTQ